MKNKIIFKTQMMPDLLLLVEKFFLEIIFDSAEVDRFLDTAGLAFKAAVH